MVAKTAPYPPRSGFRGTYSITFQTGQSARGCAALRRLTPTKHTAGPLAQMNPGLLRMNTQSISLVHKLMKEESKLQNIGKTGQQLLYLTGLLRLLHQLLPFSEIQSTL
jgi:hypothetical protein